jgi:hypothetical protein
MKGVVNINANNVPAMLTAEPIASEKIIQDSF